MGMPLLLDGGEPKPSHYGRGTGEQEAGDEVGERPGRWRIEAGREGGGDAKEPAARTARVVVLESAIDRPAEPLDDIQSPAVIAPQIRMPPPRPVRPNSDPPRIVKNASAKSLPAASNLSRSRCRICIAAWDLV